MIPFLKPRPLVSVCIPAYRSQDFIRETVQSALDQTVSDIEIIISNDGGHPTPDLRPFRSHPNVRIYEQRRRQGWVRNSNLALSKARGAFFMILPHDDLLRPTYLEECLRILEEDDAVFGAYSDIGRDGGLMIASEVPGTVEARMIHVMQNLYNGYSYRALMRRRPRDWAGLRLTPNPPSDFCVDTTWILQQAALGELRKVPRPLYWKRIHDRNTHTQWRTLPGHMLAAAWRRQCLQMGKIALRATGDAELVAELVAHRLDPRNVAEAPAHLKALAPLGCPA
ncbi:glycosyltransferase family 2 protein [Aestuariibius sp. 2305UL40-4]|uniref:glycosyltransferase family 2 protein n=1 Tax=Aestuariibius violaceus TaxID=3234132 RepID=UPI00345E4921